MDDSRVGEVVQASTTDFVAQCYELYQSPSLGSLVKTKDQAGEIYAIVYNATTSSIDPGRLPIPRGKDAASEEEIYRSSPQLARVLKSEFNCLVAGHRQDGAIHQYLPPSPPHVHAFVYQCSPEEVSEFSQSFDFMEILINTRLPVPVDELVAASLRQMSEAQADRHAFLVRAGKELAGLLSGDFNRLKAILGRMN